MRKLKVTEMGRLSLAEYKASEKQPIVVVLDHVRVSTMLEVCFAVVMLSA